jgi:hypothetical protein
LVIDRRGDQQLANKIALSNGQQPAINVIFVAVEFCLGRQRPVFLTWPVVRLALQVNDPGVLGIGWPVVAVDVLKKVRSEYCLSLG